MNLLILEDEPLIAMSMQMMAEDEGWDVVGPFATVAVALKAVFENPFIDCALLDCNLGGEPSWQVAEALAGKGIPFAFTTGQAAVNIDPRFAGRPRFTKPTDDAQVARFLKSIAASAPAG